MDFSLTDNSAEIMRQFEAAGLRALERCGQQAVSFAKPLCPVDTNNLRGSITHKVDPAEMVAYVGTDNEYGPYVELGTGVHYPGGRPTPWVYQDAKGDWHRTSGSRAQPYIKPSVADHAQTYRNTIKDELKGG